MNDIEKEKVLTEEDNLLMSSQEVVRIGSKAIKAGTVYTSEFMSSTAAAATIKKVSVLSKKHTNAKTAKCSTALQNVQARRYIWY